MLENISASHTFTKDGVYYFVRRVPTALRRHYTSSRISYSLRTRSASIAASRAIRASAQLDEYWYHLRCRDTELPGKHMLRSGAVPIGPEPISSPGVTNGYMTLSECVGVYLRLKGKGKGTTFHRAAERSCGYVIDVCGDRPISEYKKTDANTFRDALIDRGMAGSSIVRIFGTVRSVINFAASEKGLDITNPFGKVYFDRTAGVKDRQPVPLDAIRIVQENCYLADDEMRWLVSLVADTGMRLAEAAGLASDDIVEGAEGRYFVRIQPHPWRRLKTPGSAREIPLVGSAFWAAQRIKAKQGGSRFAFPRYNKTNTTNANAASAALNKWLKTYVPDGATMHSFRHSMRDRLRAVECPADIVDQIGGWQTDGVGHGYGTGYPIPILRKWLVAVA
ncbi:DUF6538 domain-containing protein [Palleronia sp. LCG004]|uniref:DUF6538 domain-containing protein n=1 Tax=Palleronia sp. LCG004 TaxID=3079304 RepID=UPI002941ECBC|nr:DUF6538 domain-containing protein [Palleronia sp. LCG004]WOI56839.1 DUF6538 domain-containing protein [Palleronia sp. LCG004]